MSRLRDNSPDDRENIHNVFILIKQLVEKNPKIYSGFWVSACLSLIADCYISSGTSYNDFCLEIEKYKEHAKKWWDENE